MFDKKKFSLLLQKAIGEYPLYEFAAKAGIDRTYLSKYVNCRRDKPLKPELIEKIASATDEVSYNDLMIASGHFKRQFYGDKLRLIRGTKSYLDYANELNIEPGTLERLEKEIDPANDILIEHIAKHESIDAEYFYNSEDNISLYYKDYNSNIENNILNFIDNDSLLNFITNPDNKPYLEFIYKAYKKGITPYQLNHAKIIIDI